ncbi:MAG: hypothetical protein ACE5IZ_07165, partial [Dehalococcoidia bacterium]
DQGRIAGANMVGRPVAYRGSLATNILDVQGLDVCSLGNWSGEGLETAALVNETMPNYRKLVWRGQRLVGAILVGPSEVVSGLNDVGMAKGLIQSRVPLGPWKAYLQQNPLDLRRPYVALKVAAGFLKTTLLGEPMPGRGYQPPPTS